MNELREYQWCGHSAIMGHVKCEWQDVKAILSYFGKRRNSTIEKYEAFVEGGINAEAEEKDKETLRLNSKITDLKSLAKVICREEGIMEDDLRSGLKSRVVTKARRIFCRITVGKMGYSGADVARFLGVTTSEVNRLAASTEVGDTKKYF